MVELREWNGTINSDLTVGADVTSATPLHANDGLASMGPAVGGRGFVLTQSQAEHLGYDGRSSTWLKRLTTGRDITSHHRSRYAIDVRDYETEDALRHAVPRVYQHLRNTVYPARRNNNDPNLRKFWWKFRRSNEIYFGAIRDLSRYVATVETTKHRIFIFVSANELVEHGVIGFGLQDGCFLGILSSRFHVCWALANGGTLEDRPRYNKDVCFDPFPFPPADDFQKQRIRVVAEELDAHRKRVLADHPHLTLTGIYNVLETLREGVPLSRDDHRVYDDGLVLILKELHDKLDAAVADAYGWRADLAVDEILARLVTLNKDRAKEEAQGLVRWLRPDYQISRFGSVKEKAELDLVGGKLGTEAALPSGPKPSFPADDLGQNIAVTTILAAASGPLDANSLAAAFKQGRRIVPKVASVLAALSRMGFVTTGDAGKTFVLRRAA